MRAIRSYGVVDQDCVPGLIRAKSVTSSGLLPIATRRAIVIIVIVIVIITVIVIVIVIVIVCCFVCCHCLLFCLLFLSLLSLL